RGRRIWHALETMRGAHRSHVSQWGIVGAAGAMEIHATAFIRWRLASMSVTARVVGFIRIRWAFAVGGNERKFDPQRFPSGPSESALTGKPGPGAPVMFPRVVGRPVAGARWYTWPLPPPPARIRRPAVSNSSPLPKVEIPAFAMTVAAPVVLLIVIRSSLFSLHPNSVPSLRKARSAMPNLKPVAPSGPMIVTFPLLRSTVSRLRVVPLGGWNPGEFTAYTMPVVGSCAIAPMPTGRLATFLRMAPVDG